MKNFADRDGRLYSFNIHTGEVTKPPPKYAAAKEGFNEFLVDGKKVSFEDRLEALETPAAPVLKRIVNSASTGSLSEKEKERLAKFMAALSFRTEAFYKGMNAQLSRKDFGPIFSELWRGAFIVAHEIARRPWIVMVIEANDVFYLGDHPLVLQNTEDPSDGDNLGFDVKGVEALMPLSPKCALYMPCTSTAEEIKSGYENALRMHRRIRSAAFRGIQIPGIGPDYLHLTQRVIGNSHPLYKAMTEGNAIVAREEIVQNLNYLQCAWAHAAVYSNCRDFTFAERVFRENPQYREVPRTRIETKWPRDLGWRPA